MRNANYWKTGLAVIIIIVGAMGALISCNRQFAIPVSAVNTPTPTATGGTGTGATVTNTATNTATMTATVPVATPSLALIDDFDNSGVAPSDSISAIYGVTDQNGTVRNGAVFNYLDTYGSTLALASSSTAYPGTTASLETSGQVSDTNQGAFAGWGLNFVSTAGVATAYDATVNNPAGGTSSPRYIGISFYVQAKSMAVSNCEGVQAVNAILTDGAGSPVTASLAFPVTQGGWTPVTLFYNQFLSSTGQALTPTKLVQVQFQILGNGYSGANNNFDILWADFQLVPASVGVPTAATPIPANIVDNFTNGSNEVQYVPASGLQGYFFNYIGSAAGDTACPLTGFVFSSAPGDVAQVVPGIPSFAAHYSGTISDYAGYGWTWAKANAQTNISAYKQLVFYAKSADVSSMNMFWVDTETNASCYGASVNSVSIPLTTSWAPVTVTFNDTSDPVQYDLGTVSVAVGTNGCTAGSYTSIPFDPTEAIQVQFEPASGAFDLWFDDMYLQ